MYAIAILISDKSSNVALKVVCSVCSSNRSL